MRNLKFFNRDMRTNAVGKNVLFSMVFKGLSILISLLLIPLTLNFIDKYNYGIWMTISSLLVWIYYFDIGIGSGLRTKLADSIARKQGHRSVGYISSAFYVLGGAMVVIAFIYTILSFFINWNDIFNVSTKHSPELNTIMLIVILTTILTFVLKLIVAIFHALQYSGVTELLNFISNLMSFILIFIYTLCIPKGSLSLIVYTLVGAPILVYAIAVVYVFKYKFPFLQPQLSQVKREYTKELIGLSWDFFIIQMINVVLYSTTSLLLSHFFTPVAVTNYSIAYRYFSITTIAFTILMNPYWGAITNAFANKDISWIKKSIKRIIAIWLSLTILTISQYCIKNPIFQIWLGNSQVVSANMAFWVMVYVIVYNFNSIFTSIMNGIGKIKVQLYASIVEILLFFPMSIFLAKQIGDVGIIIAMSILLFLMSMILYIQFRIITKVNGK